MAKKRNGRQDAIRDIVRNKDVRTQRVLVDELRAMGFDCTQATVSRDIAEMGGHLCSGRGPAPAAYGFRARNGRSAHR